MIRPFDLRDIPLVTRLENNRVSLCNEITLTHGPHPLRAALAGYFSLHQRGAHTCVACGEPSGEGFAQMRARKERGLLMHIAPAAGSGNVEGTWCKLLDGITSMAGNLGLQLLVAEAPLEGKEAEILRQAGFALYLKQDVLRLAQDAPPPPANALALKEASSVNKWAIQQLYYNTAPRLAQLAETVPQAGQSRAVRGYVLQEGSEVMAYLEMRLGSVGAWLSLMIHPQAETCAQQALEQGLVLLLKQWRGPIYCCVRRYQEWLWEPLLALGFEPLLSSAVMVRRLVAPVAETEAVRALEAHAKVASPAVRAATNHD